MLLYFQINVEQMQIPSFHILVLVVNKYLLVPVNLLTELHSLIFYPPNGKEVMLLIVFVVVHVNFID
jgi:hypothetical protein